MRTWFLHIAEEFEIGDSVVTRVDSSADSRVFRFTSALVSPIPFSMFTYFIAVQYSSANVEVYFNFSFRDANWASSCFKSSESCTNTVAWVEMASVILMTSNSAATILV